MTLPVESAIPVVIVNYGTADLVTKAVVGLLERHGRRAVELHIVENNSPDPLEREKLKAIEERWPGLITIYMETENHGFGRGNNVALRALGGRVAPPEFVFLLNPDAVPQTDVIAELVDFLEGHPKAAIAGARIEGPEGEQTIASAFRFPGVLSEFIGAARFGPLSRLLASRRIDFPPDTGTREVDWVSGAAFMARLDALKGVGFFDPAYFLYYEEMDMMHALKRRGWQIWHVAEARVRHIEGAATGIRQRDPFRRQPRYWFDSWRYYFVKNNGHWCARFCALARFSGSALDVFISKLRGRTPAMPYRFSRDFFKEVVFPLWRGDN